MARKKSSPAKGLIGAAEFKATCLELFDRVREHGAEYVVTKHGEPVARVSPIGAPRGSLHGAFASRMVIVSDIVRADLTDEWDAAR